MNGDEIEALWAMNGTLPETVDVCLQTAISSHAAHQPEKIAVHAWDGQLTYGELESRSTRLGETLRRQYGVGRETVVPLCFEKSVWTVVAMLGVLKAGGAFALLDVNHPEARLLDIIEQCQAKVVCTSAASQALCSRAKAALHVVGGEEDLINDPKRINDNQLFTPEPSSPMYVCFTSGSTGRPKGIVITHSAFASAFHHQVDAFRFHQEARVFDFASYSFDVAVYNVMMTLSVGATLCIPSEEQRKGSLNKTLREMGVTVVALTPSTSRLLEPEEVPQLETLILSGEAVTRSDLERLRTRGIQVLNAYGPAECTPMSTLNSSPITEDGISTHIGTGIGAVTWVVDPQDHSRLVSRGTPGELLLEGPILARGYLGEPEKTAAAFIEDPPWLLQGSRDRQGRRGRLYKTGDLVRYEEDGILTFIGRKDAQAKIYGQRLELGEVEHHVRQALTSAIGGQIIAEVIKLGGVEEKPALAVFMMGEDGAFSEPKTVTEDMALVRPHEGLENALTRNLPAYMVPSLYLTISSMPLSVTGKTDRGRLRELGSRLTTQRLAELRGSGARSDGEIRLPQTDTERQLRNMWADVLGVRLENIGIEDEFFWLGGDSIAAMKLVGAARKAGLFLTVASVFQHPTLTAQAGLQDDSILNGTVSSIPSFSLLEGDEVAIREDISSLCHLSNPLLVEDAYPCTPLQAGMFSLGTKRAGDYVMQAVLALRDDVQPESFKAAWNEAFRSMAILRTRIVQHSKLGLVQAVCSEEDAIEWTETDDLKAYLEKDKSTPMGAGDRLVRFALVSDARPDQPRRFVWSMHHALYDGWSLQLLADLVKNIFDGNLEVDGISERTGFSAFVKHISEHTTGLEDYWQLYLSKNEFATFPTLPMTLQEPAANASFETRLGSTKTLKSVTMSSMIRGALGLLLGQYTAYEDVVFGAVVSGRNAALTGIEDALGPTIATVPVRTHMPKNQPVVEYLEAVQREATEMIAHEQIGLQRLQKMSEEGRNACGFQTLLVVQPQPEESSSGDDTLGIWETPLTARDESITYAITLECLLASDHVQARVSFDTRVVDEWRMKQMIHQLRVILEQLTTATPDLKIGDVEALTSEDKSILREWNDPVPNVEERCIHDLIDEHATTLRPDAPAICAWDGELTHREFDDLATQLSRELISLGVGPEVIVPLCFEKSMFTVIAIVGVLKAGGAFLLLDPGLPDSRLRKLCGQAKSTVAVTSPTCHSRLSDFMPKTVILDRQFFQGKRELPAQAQNGHKAVSPSNAAYIIFTSGSTGEPKGVIIEHRSYASAVVSHKGMNMDHTMRALQFGSYNFAGSIIEILMTLIHGGCVCVLSEEERGSGLAQAIRRLDANWTFLTSTVLANIQPDDVPSLKTICVGGEPIKSAQIKQWAPKVHLRQTYGSAELSGVVGSARLGETSAPGDVGAAVSGKYWLVDATNIDRLAPLGVPGEIIVEGPVVGREYIGQPEKTAAAMIRTPAWRTEFGALKPASRFYKTGDLAVYRSDGSIQLLGRKDTQVKLRGQRIEVGEVEHQAKLATPDLLEVAVELTTLADGKRGPELVGFIILKKSEDHVEEKKAVSMAVRRIQSRLESVLPYYMVPSLLVPIPEMPLTASRKTDRRRLREMGADLTLDELADLRALSEGEKRQPQTEAERRLQSLWAEVLLDGETDTDISSVGIDDSFFRLGGDSIAAMKLVALAREAGFTIVVADIFRNPVLAAQAKILRSATNTGNETIAPFLLLGEDTKTLHLLRSEVAALCNVDRSLVEDAYPCTPLQEGLLSLTAKRAGDYVMQAVLELTEDVQLEELRGAWEETVRSVAVLRTRIVQHNQLGLLQVICSEGFDWHHSTQKLADYLEEDKARPMELGSQLSHYSLVEDGTGSRYFIWTVHHALFDGWSLPLVFDLVHDAYFAKVKAVTPSASKPVPFNSLVKYLVGLQNENAENFWQSYLADGNFAPFPALPPSVQETAADQTLEMEFTPNLTANTTTSILIRGALAMMISQYTGSSDIILGATVSGRNAPVAGIDKIIGPTIATVPVRVLVPKEQLVTEYLNTVQQDATEMIAYEQTGLQRIAKIGEDGQSACRFQTLLVIHPQDEELKTDDALGKWQTSSSQQGFTTYAITLECFLGKNGIKVRVSYDSEVVNSWKVQTMLEHFGVLLDRLANSEPGQTVSELCSITESDAKTIGNWNTASPPFVERCIHDVVSENAQKRPDARAVEAWDGNLSYQQLDQLSSHLAYHLSTKYGVGPEVVVPLCFEKSMWTVVALLSVLKAGGAFVLLDPGLPASRLEKLCRQVKATAAMTSVSCKSRLSDYVSNTIPVGWDLFQALSTDEFKEPSTSVTSSNAAYIIFTSGSTGEPKGVIIEHCSYCSAAFGHGAVMNMDTNTRSLQFGSYNFAGAIMEMIMTLIYGGCVCIPSEEERAGTRLVQTIQKLQANWAFLTSTVLANIDPKDVPSFRTICVGGEPIRAAQIKQWGAPEYNIDLRQTYGSAETSAVVSSAHLTLSSVTGEVGNATTGRYWIVDPTNSDQLMPAGAPGEVLIEGPTIGREYVGDPVKSASTFISAPSWRASFGPCDDKASSRFYKTGDLAAYRSDGSIELLGRKDTQVKLRGQRIETGEVEYQAKLASPNVKEAVVELAVVQSGKSKRPALIGFLIIETTNGRADFRNLGQHGSFDTETRAVILSTQARLETVLPHYMVPSILVPIAQIPLTISGKTDRRRLREMGSALSTEEIVQLRAATQGEKRLPRTDAEHRLRAMWSEVLNTDLAEVGIDDSFFRLGGDSISAMKLVGIARKQHGIVMAVADIFRHPVLADQATFQSTSQKGLANEIISPFSLIKRGDDQSPDTIRTEIANVCGLGDGSLIEDAYPCTSLQEGLISLTGQRTGDYTMQAVLELAADVDLDTFKTAWQSVASSTPILRTRIVHHSSVLASSLVQVVYKENIEWRQARSLEDYLRKDKDESMGLGDRLARFALIQGSPDRPRYMVWTLHHAVYDGWSLPLLVEAAGNAYQGLPLPKRTEYTSFVQQAVEEGQNSRAEAYWESYLASNEPYVTFPSTILTSSVQEPVANETVELDIKLNMKTEVTSSTVVRGALAMLLRQYTGSPDVVFGATVSGRNAPVAGIEDIVGPTIATVPVRVTVQDDLSATEYLDEIQRQATEMMPFEQSGLQRIAKINDSCRAACGFQTLLVVQPDEELQGEDIMGTWRTSPDQKGFTTYVLTVECILGLNEVKIRASFDENILSRSLVLRMVQQLGIILDRLVLPTTQAQTIAEIDAQAAAQDIAKCWEYNEDIPEPIETTIHTLIAKRATIQPDGPAVMSWDGDFTHKELDDLSSRLAQHLIDLGVGSEVIVPLCFEKSKWTVVAILAVLKAGGAFLLLDATKAVDKRRDHIIQETGAKVVLTSVQNAELIATPGLSIVAVGPDVSSLAPHSTEKTPARGSASSAAYIIYTSGSTGQPKGVVIEHRSISTSCFYHGRAASFGPHTRTLQFASYTFDACIVEILTTLVYGGCICVPSDSNRTNVEDSVNTMSVNTAVLTPGVARLIEPASVPSLKTLVLCGEKPTDKDIKQWSGLDIMMNGYGPTECTVCCTINDTKANRSGACIGFPVGAIAWLVAPDNHDRLVPIGAVGELVMEGAILARGYVNNSEKTSHAFIKDPAWLINGPKGQTGRHGRLYKTGDLARYNLDGSLTFLGRKDTQIKIRGQRLELGEVEYHVQDCLGPQVQVRVDMISLKGGKDSAVLAAFIAEYEAEDAGYISSEGDGYHVLSRLAEGTELVRVSDDVEAAISQRLLSYMVPSVYFRLSKIPLKASGKVDRDQLQKAGQLLTADDLASLRTVAVGEKRQPQTEEEKIIRDVWARVLKLKPDAIGLDDSFIQVGGDSITAMMVVGDARRLGLDVGVADVLHQPGLHHLASAAKLLSGDYTAQEIPVIQHGDGPIEQSFAQGRLWFLDQLYPNSTLYLMPFAMRLRGNLNLEALQTSLLAVESRHETLRTVFDSRNDVDLQIVRPFQPSPLNVVDISSSDDFSHILHREQNTPFNLRTDAGWRITLYRLGGEEYVLSLMCHHIISDGWSAGVLQRELSTFYSAALRDQDPLSMVSPLPIQYRDYTIWQRQQEQAEEHQRQLEYWVTELENSQPAELLCDKPRPAVLSGKAELQEVVIEDSVYNSLQRFCKQHDVTPFVVLLSAFRATHYHLSGSKDATIGTANANRDRWQLKEMIGFFVNMQCIRIKVDEEYSFEQLVQHVQDTTKESHQNQDVPFEKIVSRLKKTRDMSRQPLVQIVFTLHSQPDLGKFTFEGMETEQIPPPLTSRFDIELHFTQGDGCLKGEVVYSTDLYSSETVSNMLSLFQKVLEQALKEPTVDMNSLAAIADSTADHDYALLDKFGLVEVEHTDYPRDLSIVDVFRQHVTARPDRIAVKDTDTELTYAQLDSKSDQVANWLRGRGLAEESLIGVYASRSAHTIVAFLGILKANLAYVPLDVRSPTARVETILSAIEGQRLVLLGPGVQPPQTQLVDVEFASIDEILEQPQLQANGASAVNGQVESGPSPSSLAYVMFTSGSTGKPKGVEIEHRGIVRLSTNNNLTQQLPENNIMAHMGNIAFDITTWEIYAALLNGGTLICIDAMTVLDNIALAKTFISEQIKASILTPALLKNCLIDSPDMVAQLKMLLVGGDKVDGEDLSTAQTLMQKGSKIINAYGPTENTVISTFYCLPENETFKAGTRLPIGRAMSNSGAYVVDSQLRLVALGVIGELVVTGDGLARGYTIPELNANRFVSLDVKGQRVRAYKTGDYVRYRPVDGQMEFFGRMDGQVKIRGQRVELGEIESVLRTHGHVADAVVVVAPQQDQDEEAPAQLAGFVTILEDDSQQETNHDDDSEDESEAQQVELWKHLFDSDKYTAVEDVQSGAVGRDFTSWTSMYNGELIDHDEMNEWLDDAISSLLNGREAGNVLEIGTGTGMILFNLINNELKSYVGLEPTEKAIEFVAKTAKSIPGLAEKVYLQKGTATDIGRLKKMDKLNSPNLVVINSVAQYFPSQSYLLKLVEDLVQLEGVETIHFGDMRSWALYKQFSVTKALHILGDGASKEEIRRQMADIEREEQELLVDPGFFTALLDKMPHLIDHVEVIPKRMKATNELSCYRYSAVLHVKTMSRQTDPIHNTPQQDWIDFQGDNLNRALLSDLLKDHSPTSSTVAISNIPHSKSVLERFVVESLSESRSDSEWISSASTKAKQCHSLSAVDLQELAEETGYQVEISWARQHSLRGGFDAIFHKQDSPDGSRALFRFPTDHAGRPSYSLSSRPLHQQFKQKVQQQLLERLQIQLPSYMVPQTITVLDKMPVNDNGKVDRKVLAASTPRAVIKAQQSQDQQPASEMELQLLSIWAKVLYMEPSTIGLEDNFFQLGGNSLEAMKVVRQARKLGIELTVADIFRHPTLASLAKTRTAVVTDHTEHLESFALLSSTEASPAENIRQELSTIVGVDASQVDDAYPCTPLQEGLMSLTAKKQGNYVMQAVFELSGHIDLANFKNAWNHVVGSTEILRTRIVQFEQYGLTQVVCNGDIQWHESSNLEDYIEHDNRLPMELGHSLSRFAVITDVSSRYFVWTVHHALYDGWTVPRVMGLVSDAYRGIELTTDRPGFNAFVKHVLNVKSLDAEAYWRSYLADGEFGPFPALPPSVSEPAADNVLETNVAISTTTKSEVTMPTIVRGALGILLSQYMNSSDVIFGSVVSGRNAPIDGIENLLGPTIATVPIRVQVRNGQHVQDYLRSLQQETVDMIDFEQTGLQRIISIGEEGRRGCSFQTLLVVQPAEPEVEEESKLGTWRTLATQKGFDITYALVLECFLGDGDNDTKIRASFDSRVISKSQVSNLIQQFGLIVEELSRASSTQTVGEIDSLTTREEAQIWEWNETVPETIDVCLHDLVKKQIDIQPDALAVCGWEQKDITYRELDDLSSRLARHLVVNLRVTPKDIIPLSFNKSIWMVVAMLAVLRAGGTFLPIDPTQATDRREQILKETGAKVVLSSSQHARILEAPGRTVIAVNSNMLSRLPVVTDNSLPSVTPSSAAYMIFTSGSTGIPKGTVIEHRAVSSSCTYHGPVLGFKKNTRTLQFSSYTFDASIMEIFTTLIHGGTVCVPSDDERLSNIEKSINRMAVSLCFLTPSVARLMEPSQVPSLRSIAIGGERVTEDDMQRWTSSGAQCINAYGPTECAIISSANPSNTSGIGKTVGSVSWIVSPDDPNRLMPLGTIGELLLEGPILARGYFNRPDLTLTVFIDDPVWLLQGARGYLGRHGRMYKTGDLVRYHEDGSLEYIGRKDTQVKLRGQRLELSEVEHHVLDCIPSVHDAIAEVVELGGSEASKPMLAVFSTVHGVSDNSLRSSVSLVDGVELAWLSPEVKTVLSKRLPSYMVPTLFFRLETLPLTSAGKVDRRKLRELASTSLSAQQLVELQRTANEEVKRSPSLPTETLLQKLWAQSLNVSTESIGLDDSFLGVGGDSIMAMKLVAASRKAGLALTVTDLFKYATLEALARHLNQSVQEQSPLETISSEPFSLLDSNSKDQIIQDASASVCVSPRDIADIYPVTGFQKDVINLSKQWPQQSLNYIFLDFGLDLDHDRLQTACLALIQRFSSLRSAFVIFQDKYYQVVLKELFLPVSVSETTEDLVSASNNICLADTQLGFTLGEPPTSFMIIRNATQGSRLIIRLSHAQYDGVLLPYLFTTLLELYQGINVTQPVTEFSSFLQYREAQKSSSSAYWQKLLQGSKMTDISSFLLPEPMHSSVQGTPTERVIVEDTVDIPQLPQGITLASVISSAWATVLSQITGEQDVVYGSLVSGRNVDVPVSADIIAGPCVNIVPVRAQIPSSQGSHEILSSVQEQNHAAQTHSLDLEDVAKAEGVDWSPSSDFDSVVQHQGVEENPEFEHSGSKLRVNWFENPSHMPPRLVIMSYPVGSDKVKIRLLANSHITTHQVAETLISKLGQAVDTLLEGTR